MLLSGRIPDGSNPIKLLVPDTADKDPAMDGDTILSLSRGYARSIKVSSAVLSNASPVFKRMFLSQFREGEKYSPESPKTIQLPDDDTNAMVWFCYLLHSQDLRTEDRPPQDFVAQLVVVADKWDCLPSIYLWIELYMQFFSHANAWRDHCSYPEDREAWGLLRLAFLVGNNRAFYAVSTYLSYGTASKDLTHEEDSVLGQIHLGELPPFVKDIMMILNQRSIDRIYGDVEDIIHRHYGMVPGTCKNARGKPLPFNLCRYEGRLVHFYSELKHLQVWPKSKLREGFHAASAYIDQLDRYQNWIYIGEDTIRRLRRYDTSKCACMAKDIRSRIRTITGQEKNMRQKGLCLACVRIRMLDPEFDGIIEDGNCRSSSQYEHKKAMNDLGK